MLWHQRGTHILAIEETEPQANDRHEALIAMVRHFWAAMDARAPADAAPLVADDAVFIDSFAPHIWSGPGAFDAWLSALWAFCVREDIVIASTALRDPTRCTVTDEHAYIVVPAIMASARHGDLISQPGVITATLALRETGWRITGMCWSGQ